MTMLVDFISLLYPEVCLGCQNALVKGETELCTSCKIKLPYTNYHLEVKNPVWKRFLGKVQVRRAYSFLFFVKHGMVQKVLHELKYKGNEHIGYLIGVWYGERLKTSINLDYDLIVPVPMHKRKQQKRGYNQVDSFAQGLSESLETAWSAGCLMKVDETTSQTRKGRFDRWENVKEVFVIPHPEEVQGRRILLVDDVITTGSTLEACAHVLLKAGAVYVDVATIACAT